MKAVVAALAITFAAQPVPELRDPQRVPVDAVAAVVERRVITRSEVEAEARLVLLERAGPEAAVGPLETSLVRAVLDTVVAQELLALEARRTGVVVREVDIDKAVAALRARFTDADAARGFLLRAGVDEDLLRGRARRDLAAQALLTRAFATLADGDGASGKVPQTSEERDAAKRAIFQDLLGKVRRDVEVRVVWRP